MPKAVSDRTCLYRQAWRAGAEVAPDRPQPPETTVAVGAGSTDRERGRLKRAHRYANGIGQLFIAQMIYRIELDQFIDTINDCLVAIERFMAGELVNLIRVQGSLNARE